MFVPARPCPNCPWAKTTPPGEFTEERYEELRNTSPDEDGYGPDWGAPLFACHKSQEGKDYVCAGWLASVGRDHPSVRLAVMQGEVDMCSLEPKDGWPELFTDYETMKSTQQRSRAACGVQDDQEG